jgi:hypothetical protein
MKRIFGVILLALGMIAAGSGVSYASDWDTAGKVLTVIEGLRVVSGGQVDIIGSVTGIDKGYRSEPVYRETVVIDRGGYHRDYYPRYARYRPKHRWVEKHEYRCEPERIWVPHYTYRQKYVPRHLEYRDGRQVIVEGHYVSYKVEDGGHWETRYY